LNKEKGYIKNIGVCNVRTRHLEAWKEKDILPSYVQIERHPLRTCKEEMNYCKEHNITVLSYSPLGRMLPQIKESEILKELSVKYNKNIGQIILRWQIDTNAIPVFTSKTSGRIAQNTDIMDFHLEHQDIESIEKLNCNYKIFLESWGCPGF
jgi:diketogulonate reductase-like aldo/keto reductase